MSDKTKNTNAGSSSPTLTVAFYLSSVVGLAFFLLGLYSVFGSGQLPLPLAFSLIIVGFLEATLGYFATKKVRVAWSFATSLNGTLGTVLLFAAPKIRDTAEIAMGLAVIPAFILGAITVVLWIAAEDL